MRHTLGWMIGLTSTLLLGCDNRVAPVAPDLLAPTERALQIQQRLTNTIIYLYAGHNTIWWVWHPDDYELGQMDDGQLIVWEKGKWWIQQIAGGDYFVLERRQGAFLRRTEMGYVWEPYGPVTHRIGFTLLGTSLQDPDLQIEMNLGSRTFTYRFAPIDSLEAIKNQKF